MYFSGAMFLFTLKIESGNSNWFVFTHREKGDGEGERERVFQLSLMACAFRETGNNG